MAATPEPASAIALERVSKRFGSVTAVDRADLEVRRGEFFSLLGPSGCGKTTLLRLIAGFEHPNEGRIRLDGRDVTDVPPQHRNVNTVFQQYALFPHLTVYENLAFGPRASGKSRGEIERCVRPMLDLLRLGDLAARRPAELSGGQRQRVALGRALVNLPGALLLDEPLAALDRQLRLELQLELKRIQREVGISFLFVTHDQEEALTLSDRIAVLDAGRVEQVGTPREIYRAPTNAFVATFVGAANLWPVAVERLDDGLAQVRLPGGRAAQVASGSLARDAANGALLLVRPEDVRLSQTEPAPGGAAIPVVVVEVGFRGAFLGCRLRDPEGREFAAHLSSLSEASDLRAGDPAWASWPEAAARLLPPSAAADQSSRCAGD